MRVEIFFLASWLLFACETPAVEPIPTVVPCNATPAAIDFGEADATIDGASVRARIRVSNQSAVDRRLVALPLTKPFSVLPVPGGFRLPAGSTRDFTVFFTPSDGLLHLDEFRLVDEATLAGDCQVRVALRGVGSGTLSLAGVQAPLDFGFMEPGATQRLGLSVSNSTRSPIPLGAVNVVFDSGFSLPEPVTLQLPPQLVVPASGALTFELVAAPEVVGAVSGRVIFTSAHSLLQAPFVLTVGKPEAELFPESLGPWLVGFDRDSAPHGFSERTLRLRNVGTSGPSQQAGLRILSVSIAALEGSSTELQVNVPPRAFLGLASGESTDLLLHLEPLTVGPKEFLVTFFTNSPDAPRVVVPIHASAEELPFCELEVSPPRELTLAPIGDDRAAGTVTFTNLGAGRCIVDDLRLINGAEQRYAIVNGPTPQLELLPGQQHEVTIIGPHTQTLSWVGSLAFHVFNPGTGTQLVHLYSTP